MSPEEMRAAGVGEKTPTDDWMLKTFLFRGRESNWGILIYV